MDQIEVFILETICAKIKPLVLDSNTGSHLTVCKQMSNGSFKNVTYGLFLPKLYLGRCPSGVMVKTLDSSKRV